MPENSVHDLNLATRTIDDLAAALEMTVDEYLVRLRQEGRRFLKRFEALLARDED